MKILKTYKNIPQNLRGSVVVIGNFDGVHLGHKALIDKAKEIAADIKGRAQDDSPPPVIVLTFEPHPRSIFRPEEAPFRLTPFKLKAKKLEEYGVDAVCALEFNWDFAGRSADSFIQNILIEGLAVAHVVVGYDFKFGQLRKGNAETIRSADIPVSVVEKVGEISSTAIRQALRRGDIKTANNLLSWDWEIGGVVASGDKRGRELGYPTANFDLEDIIHPRYGVYASKVRVSGEEHWRDAAINIGIRPMFEVPHARVESYIFDFDREIYGETLHVRPVAFLRGEAKFDSLEALVEQMDKDCAQAKEILDAYN